MKILVVGASGRTGGYLVNQGAARGLEVTALVRQPEMPRAFNPVVQVMTGDVLDEEQVLAAVRGQEAVVCALGPAAGSPPALCSDGTGNILRAMHHFGVRRLVCITGAMVGHPRERLGLVYRLLQCGRALQRTLEDRRRQEALIAESELDWTIVRPPRLTDGRARGVMRVGSDIPIGSLASVSRADVAAFMLDQLDRAEYTRRAVAVAY